MDKNDDNNCLHNGYHRYENQIYAGHVIQGDAYITVEFSCLSPDMEQGFPGNVDIPVAYTITHQKPGQGQQFPVKFLYKIDKNPAISG